MENKNIKLIENNLKYGIIPDFLDYNLDKDILDDNRLQYNSYYSSPEFILQKYVPKAMMETDYMAPVVEQIIKDKTEYNNLVSLLDQITLKSQS